MRYQVFDSEDPAQHRFSAPWKWLAMYYASTCTLGWKRCRVVDATTHECILDWARSDGIVFDRTNSQPDGQMILGTLGWNTKSGEHELLQQAIRTHQANNKSQDEQNS